jgi:hypothetical protein
VQGDARRTPANHFLLREFATRQRLRKTDDLVDRLSSKEAATSTFENARRQ